MQVNIKEWIAFLCQMWWGRRKYADTITIFGHMLKNIGSVIQFEQLSNILKNIFKKQTASYAIYLSHNYLQFRNVSLV